MGTRRRLDSVLDAETLTASKAVAFSVKNVQCVPATENMFGQVVAGHLEITAGIIQAVINGSTLHDFSGKIRIGEITPDDRSEIKGVKVVHCVCFESGAGLSLIPVPHTPATYRRIGYIRELKFDCFAEAKVTQIIII